MTRGMKGCFVYCTDPALAAYLRSRVQNMIATTRPDARSEHSPAESFVDHQFRRVTESERLAGRAALPVIDLRRSLEDLLDQSSMAAAAMDWIAPPDWVTPQAGMFVAQATDGPLTPRVSVGTWCLFRLSAQYASKEASNGARADNAKQTESVISPSLLRGEMVAENAREDRRGTIEFLAELHR